MFTGGSFKDATRVAQLNVPLWSELLTENKDNVLTMLEMFQNCLDTIKQSILREEGSALENILQRAADARARL
jgi:prephenate dehydrogenase